MDEFYTVLGKELRDIRKSQGRSVVYVISFIGVSSSTYAAYELGKARMRMSMAYKVCKVFNVDFKEVVCRVIDKCEKIDADKVRT